MPLFVKPLRSDASLGIAGKSLVHDTVALMERVAHIRKELNDSALAEEFIDGREFYVGVLGNRQAKALPPIEIDFTGFPEGVPKVMDSKAKWDERSKEYKGTKSVLANLPDELRARLQKVAVDAYRALRVRDYGRVDLRLTDTGDIYVLEVNASCYLERHGEFAMAARAMGLDYPRLIERIVEPRPRALRQVAQSIPDTRGGALVRRGRVRLGPWKLPTPSPSIVAGQLIVPALDWTLAGAALYVLLPGGHGLGFLTFLAVFLIAQFTGLVSHVPGGIGVVESIMVVLLGPYIAPSDLLGSLVAYRLIYYLLPFGLAVLSIGVYEARPYAPKALGVAQSVGGWLPRSRAAGALGRGVPDRRHPARLGRDASRAEPARVAGLNCCRSV